MEIVLYCMQWQLQAWVSGYAPAKCRSAPPHCETDWWSRIGVNWMNEWMNEFIRLTEKQHNQSSRNCADIFKFWLKMFAQFLLDWLCYHRFSGSVCKQCLQTASISLYLRPWSPWSVAPPPKWTFVAPQVIVCAGTTARSQNLSSVSVPVSCQLPWLVLNTYSFHKFTQCLYAPSDW